MSVMSEVFSISGIVADAAESEPISQNQSAFGTAIGNIGTTNGNANRTFVDNSTMYNPSVGNSLGTESSRLAFSMSLYPHRIFSPDDPKPQHSYIGLIAMAILSSAESKLVLSDIYQYILENYPYFRTRGPGWRNSIRHNLSLNDCFIKAGRSANGKGHYWAIHPANIDDFRKGDFRRRKAQRKVRRHMGLSVDDTGAESPSPPPLDLTGAVGLNFATINRKPLDYIQHDTSSHFHNQNFFNPVLRNRHFTLPARYGPNTDTGVNLSSNLIYRNDILPLQFCEEQEGECNNDNNQQKRMTYINKTSRRASVIANLCSKTRKRQFDVASLLAPDKEEDLLEKKGCLEHSTRTQTHTVITKVSVQKQRQKCVRAISPGHGLRLHLTKIEDQEDIDVVASDSNDSISFNLQRESDLGHNIIVPLSSQNLDDINGFSSPNGLNISDNSLRQTNQHTNSELHIRNTFSVKPFSKPSNTSQRIMQSSTAVIESTGHNLDFLMKKLNNQPLDKSKELLRLDHELLERWHGPYVARRMKTVDLSGVDDSDV